VGEWDEANETLLRARKSVADLVGDDFRTEIHQLLLARIVVELEGVRAALATDERLDQIVELLTQIAAKLGDDED
jgi:hypothetical protein